MKQSQMNFHSVAGTKAGHTERLSTQEDSLAGFSNIRQTKLDRIHKERRLSPKSVKRKVNTFIDEKVLKNPEATAVFFEALSTGTTKIHRHALHSKIESMEDTEVRARGQTAGVGIRLNPKLANSLQQRSGLVSQSNVQRKAFKNNAYDPGSADMLPRPDTQGNVSNFMNKSGFSYYPGQPLQVSTGNMLGQTINKFEQGEQDSVKLKTQSGVEYYKQHIHFNQQRRLKKYIRDAAGHAPQSKNFKPLTDVAKPSMKGRVKMYMEKLEKDERDRKNQQQQKTPGGQHHENNLINVVDGQHKSNSMIGSVDQSSAHNDYTSRRVGMRPPNTLEPLTGRDSQVGLDGTQKRSTRHKSSKHTIDPKSFSTPQQTGSMKAIGVRRNKKIDAVDLGASFGGSKRFGKSVNPAGKQSQIKEEDEEEFNRQAENNENMQTPEQRANKGSMKQKKNEASGGDDKNATASKFGGKLGAISKLGQDKMKHLAKNMATASEARRKDVKKNVSSEHVQNLSQEEFQNFLYRMIQNYELFKPIDSSMPTSSMQQRELTVPVQSAYKKINNISHENKEDNMRTILNVKIVRKTLLAYLKKRYTSRLASKLTCIFDWSNQQLEYDVFYSRMDAVLLRPKDLDLMKTLKKFAFQMLDMNCDSHLCETDLFTFLELHKDDEYYQNIMIYDIQDIAHAFRSRNETLTRTDDVMDNSNPNAPRIKNLSNYLLTSKQKMDQRRDIINQDFFSSMNRTPGLESQDKQNGEAAVDPNDLYHQFGAAYKNTFMKMTGQTSKQGGGGGGVAKDSNDTSKQMHRQNVTKQSLDQMQNMGGQQFVAEQKKRPQLSYFIHKKTEEIKEKQEKKDDLAYQKDRAFLTEKEFTEQIQFRFGIPLCVLDFIDYTCGSDLISKVRKYVDPPPYIERFDATNAEFVEQKTKIDEDFLPWIFQIFNALGQIPDLTALGKNATQEEKESRQHLTLDSMKKNLSKVFGIRNDYFAEMLFVYISNNAPLTHIINFNQFLTRLKVFWPKKESIPSGEDQASKEWRERNAKQAHKAAMRAFMFDFIRVSGGKSISILDLVKLCCYFKDDSCNFGAECNTLMAKYKKLNIEPKYVHEMTEFGFQQYLKNVPYSCLIADLEFGFVGQIHKMINKVETMSDDHKRTEEQVPSQQFPLSNWKMNSIYDENECYAMGNEYGPWLVTASLAQPPPFKTKREKALLSKENLEVEEKKEREEKESRVSYKQTLERRTGQAGIKEVEGYHKKGEPFVERKIDRGFDIVNTWKFKQTYLNQD